METPQPTPAANCHTFLASHISDIQPSPSNTHCSICKDPYMGADSPVQIQGTSGCTHIFGRYCLQESLKTSNKCPYCRAILFHIPSSNTAHEIATNRDRNVVARIRPTGTQDLYPESEWLVTLTQPSAGRGRTRRETSSVQEQSRGVQSEADGRVFERAEAQVHALCLGRRSGRRASFGKFWRDIWNF
ncbi:hypothetical protein P153DRAFT_353057 [Dothidotthia symphoricarpi CBS 119687]|uniref:RING-type domain-containing protein n=1 Tax=Dothidotthia symphoricarpi CBS 119687 TaxID=1392245 RepID=A0A6A6AS49_9PLEO|nr:uncharacterized protein P153DRAFT_353057 [Dothidotthia symphoricarpi CBS 119687]KAF2133815.1 hypothetical protein P153DRAFT_353057 [Dothidotthia symphoricarpi CBS 119687]